MNSHLKGHSINQVGDTACPVCSGSCLGSLGLRRRGGGLRAEQAAARAVPAALNTASDHLAVSSAQVPRPAQCGERVNELRGQVDAAVAELPGAVVPRKHMVEVVPALAHRQQA